MNRSPNRPSSRNAVTCELPLGLWVNGKREHLAVLRSFGEGRQRRLLDLDFTLPRERALSQALAAFVESIGSARELTADLMEQLTLSDRHALVRALLLSGSSGQISATATCAACTRRLELTFDLKAVELPRIPDSGRVPLTRRDKGRTVRRHLQIPKATELVSFTEESSLVAHCLGCTAKEANLWLSAAEAALSALDPLGHLEVVGSCVDCNTQVRAEVDPAAHWLSNLRANSGTLIEEVHRLALRYHWTEHEILLLPDARRQAYLDLCWEVRSEPVELVM